MIQGFAAARVLIVDDEPVNVSLLTRILRTNGYTEVLGTSEPRTVPAHYAAFRPDIILLDLHMPELNGFDVLDVLRGIVPAGTYLPILILTGDDSPQARERALAAGAMDFLGKPFELTEVLLRIRNLLQTRFMYLELQMRNEQLDMKVRERTRELEEARLDILDRLAAAAEYRDDATGQHTRRVGRIGRLLALELGLSDDDACTIQRASMLHDVGKIGVPDSILLKPGKLTAEEFAVMRTHTTIGQRILSQSAARMLQVAEQIALTHHERWDGHGYIGMAGTAIPLVGRIVCVVDVFDALTHERPYRGALQADEALALMRAERGHQFDPEVLDAFLALAARVGTEFLTDDIGRPPRVTAGGWPLDDALLTPPSGS
jgi:putative two-component system response regulator